MAINPFQQSSSLVSLKGRSLNQLPSFCTSTVIHFSLGSPKGWSLNLTNFKIRLPVYSAVLPGLTTSPILRAIQKSETRMTASVQIQDPNRYNVPKEWVNNCWWSWQKWNRSRECSQLYNETQGTMDLVGCRKISNNNICNNNIIIIYFLTPDEDFLSKVFVCNCFLYFVV